MRTVAVIAAKANSTRVPRKNFREFHEGKSLLDTKVEQCVNSGVFDSVYVSSDSEEARWSADRYGAVFVPRDPYLCEDSTSWGDVLTGVLDSLPEEGDPFVCWTPATSPLFDRFGAVLEELRLAPGADSVVTVTPLKHYYLGSDFIPINHQWGPWHAYSQGMKPIYQLNLALMGAMRSAMVRNRYLIGDRPLFFMTSEAEGLDIDTMEEFELAQYRFGNTQFHNVG